MRYISLAWPTSSYNIILENKIKIAHEFQDVSNKVSNKIGCVCPWRIVLQDIFIGGNFHSTMQLCNSFKCFLNSLFLAIKVAKFSWKIIPLLPVSVDQKNNCIDIN